MVSERVESWLRRRPVVADAGLAVLLWSLDLLLQPDRRLPVIFSGLLACGVLLRRARPVWCAALVTAVAFAQWLVLPERGLLIADLAVPLAVHATAAYGPRWAARTMLAAGLAGAALGSLTWPPVAEASAGSHALFAAAMAGFVLAGWALGSLRRVREERVAALTERARLLEVERDQKALLAVSAERTRIAREMHDVVAHSLAVVISQADGGRYAGSPDAAQAALATIGETGRRAMGETRRLLGLLRDGPDPLSPQPGLFDVPALVDQARAGGLDVALRLDPPPTAVSTGLGLVVYRIVQESLTNVIKHAGPAARASVEVCWNGSELHLRIADDGRGPVGATGTSGHGVVGMRERAATYGGTVRTGPRPGGGHEVYACIPVPA
ncbi:sensor histidine kinase [Cryptosporangium minutisporangium]|uniref:histidine kinase n=1 Tax=Cryptosporangium minutisporangium TaxID=113569 RepID=A0ABP6TB80_9ACTN